MVNLPMTACQSRRALALGLAGVAGAAMTGRVARAQQPIPTPVVTGNCALEPGVHLLIDWRLGKPVMSVAELIPPLDWVFCRHLTMPLVFRYPPDWTSYALWADSSTETGMPIWRDTQPLIPQLTLARIVSPAEDAAFDFAGGIIQEAPMALAETAVIAKLGIVGE